MIIWFNPHTDTKEVVAIFYKEENYGLELLRNLAKLLINEEAETPIQGFLTPKPGLTNISLTRIAAGSGVHIK